MHPVQPTKKKVHVLQEASEPDPLVLDWVPPLSLVSATYGATMEPRIDVEAERYLRSPLRTRVSFGLYLVIRYGDRRDEEGLREGRRAR